jgi:hypothetical protein
MNGDPNTDFSGMASPEPSFPAVASSKDATDSGRLEIAHVTLKKPFRLERWEMPEIKSVLKSK